ncbi:MAG: hypothetical protein ACREP0_01645 [Rhodanobacteraceae bacterium]
MSDRIGDAAAAKTEVTDFKLQNRCAAAAKRYYRAIHVPDGRSRIGFGSNYNPAMGGCFLTYHVAWSSAGSVFHKTVIVSPVRRFVDGNCVLAQKSARGQVATCWVWWHGRLVRNLTSDAFREYRARFMGAPMGVAGE